MKQFLISVDQTLNTIIPVKGDGFGYSDETISARAFRLFLQDVIDDTLYRSIDKLFFWDKNHCYHSWHAEHTREHLPKHYRS